MSKTEVIIKEDGTREYKKICPRCRKTFVCTVPSQIYCCEACHEGYLKRRKSKSKSCKRYQKKHDVSRAAEASSRSLARRMMQHIWEPVDALTGKKFDSWDHLQCHHLNLDALSNSVTNTVPLTAESHAFVHAEIKKKFGKDIEDKLYKFGRGVYNFNSLEEFTEFVKLREEVVNFQLSMFKLQFGKPLPVFDTED